MVNLRARGLEDLAVLHTTRADGLAGTTVETGAHLLLKRITVDANPPVSDCFHQINATTRRILLKASFAIGWARRETQATVHTRIDDSVARRVVPGKRDKLNRAHDIDPHHRG